jgi:hypothetical protein
VNITSTLLNDCGLDGDEIHGMLDQTIKKADARGSLKNKLYPKRNPSSFFGWLSQAKSPAWCLPAVGLPAESSQSG